MPNPRLKFAGRVQATARSRSVHMEREKEGRQRAIDSPSQISTRARNIDPRQRSRRLCPPSVLFPAVLPAPPSSSPQRARAMTCMTCCATFPRHVPLRCPRASHVPGPVLHAPSSLPLLSPPSLPPPAASLLAGHSLSPPPTTTIPFPSPSLPHALRHCPYAFLFSLPRADDPPHALHIPGQFSLSAPSRPAGISALPIPLS